MTATESRPPSQRDLRRTVAAVITEVFAPVVLVIGLVFVVAVHESGSWPRGLYFGAIAALFAGVIPYSIVLTGVRLGHLGDRHVFERAERPVMMLLGLVSVSFGLWAMHLLDVPRGLFALVAAMLAGLATTLAITVWWKISIHTAVAAGTAATLVAFFGPLGALWLPVVAAVAWSRVAVRAHTSPQVIVGAIVGAAISSAILATIA